jgi:hypothetical protein
MDQFRPTVFSFQERQNFATTSLCCTKDDERFAEELTLALLVPF